MSCRAGSVPLAGICWCSPQSACGRSAPGAPRGRCACARHSPRGALRGAPQPGNDWPRNANLAPMSPLRADPRGFKPAAGSFAGRVILVTGASSGLGRALAIECARAGASVILSGRNGAKLERVYDEIEKSGAPQPAIALLDLATATAVDYDSLANVIDAEFGKLDGLVHAAALLGDRTPLEQYDVPTWCKVLHVNLTAPFILTQVLLPNLRKSADASVIFVSSGVVHKPRAYWGADAVSKTGLEADGGLVSQEREDEKNIRFNSIDPGRMRTSMRAAAYPAEDPNTLPAPGSVASPFLYLLSAQGRGIDGQY